MVTPNSRISSGVENRTKGGPRTKTPENYSAAVNNTDKRSSPVANIPLPYIILDNIYTALNI